MTKYGLEARKRFNTSERTAIFLRHGGVCCICGQKIDGAREKWIIEHIIALELGGNNDDANLAPAHEPCAIEKTKADHSRGAKLKRVYQKHIGAKAPSRNPLPGSKGSRFKKKVGGGVVARDEE